MDIRLSQTVVDIMPTWWEKVIQNLWPFMRCSMKGLAPKEPFVEPLRKRIHPPAYHQCPSQQPSNRNWQTSCSITYLVPIANNILKSNDLLEHMVHANETLCSNVDISHVSVIVVFSIFSTVYHASTAVFNQYIAAGCWEMKTNESRFTRRPIQ